jgi:amino acid adenylation domain-containing protein
MRVDQLIAEQALRNPSAIAVEFDRSGKTLSYAELEERAARVADAIASATAAPGRTVSAGQAIVCINTDRSIGMVVGLVGIWKSGSAYVPIDPHYPCERQQYILDDSQSNVLVTLVSQSTSEAVKRAQQQGITVIYLDDHGNLLSVPKQPPRSSIQAVQTDQSDGALAYVLYTSGSTGKPKGCMIQHSNVMNMLRHFRDDLSVSNSGAVLCVTTFCFDISVLELFLPLTSGAKLILIASETQADGFALLDLINAHSELSIMQATPATYEMLSTCGFSGRADLIALCGGEAFRPNLLRLRFKRFINTYGPTETCVWSSTCDVHEGLGVIPIGRPIANTTFRILDEHFSPVEKGTSGELWIGGAGVAKGYFNRPELTEEKFVYMEQHGERLYGTGDIAYQTADGQYVCEGRRDSQIKFRGFRIELGEIESVICKLDASIDAAIVVVRNDLKSGVNLVAYLKLRGAESMLDAAALKTCLETKLPAYMVPRFFVIMGAFPMTPNLKVDREKLPKPDEDMQVSHALSSNTDHRTVSIHEVNASLEEQIAGILFDTTGVRLEGPQASMEMIGLDSLGSVLLVATLRKKLGVAVAPASIQTHGSSLRAFTHHVSSLLGPDANVAPSLAPRQAAKEVAFGPAAAAGPSLVWKTDFSTSMNGLRGILILWVTWAHFTMCDPAGVQALNFGVFNRYQIWNTGSFLLVSGFVAHVQNRDAQLDYSSFLISKWFALIPLYLLAFVPAAPSIFAAATAKPVPMSKTTAVYVSLMNFFGVGMIGNQGNFGFLHNATAFDYEDKFGDVGVAFLAATGVNYFGTLLFVLFVVYAVFHKLLTFRIPRRFFRHGFGACLMLVSFLVASISLGSIPPPEDNAAEAGSVMTSGTFTYMMPLLLLGVCVAELRFHLPPMAHNVLGHWVVVDLSIWSFFLFTFQRIPELSNVRPWGIPESVTPRDHSALDDWHSAWTIVVDAAQPVLFCFMLLCLSCQVYHRKRSVTVLLLFRRSVIADLFGKYSYAIYLFQIPLSLAQPFMRSWMCMGGTNGICSPLLPVCYFTATAGWAYQLFLLFVTVCVAIAAQWWQDTFVAPKYAPFMEFWRSSWLQSVRSAWKDPQNPLNHFGTCAVQTSGSRTNRGLNSSLYEGDLSQPLMGAGDS